MYFKADVTAAALVVLLLCVCVCVYVKSYIHENYLKVNKMQLLQQQKAQKPFCFYEFYVKNWVDVKTTFIILCYAKFAINYVYTAGNEMRKLS